MKAWNRKTNGAAMSDVRVEKAKSFMKELVPFMGMVLVFLLFALTTNGKFTTTYNIRIILTQSVIIMIMGVGVSFVMAHGNLAFYVGGLMALCAIVASITGKVSAILSLPAAMLVGVLCCLFISWAHVVMKVQAIIAGMCVMFIGRALAQGMYLDFNLSAPAALIPFDKPAVYIGILLVVLIIGYILMEYTKVGKYNKAIGSNPQAALFSGIPVGKYKMIAFAITGVCTAICGWISLLQGRGVSATTGASVEMNTLIALVLGGMPLSGGMTVKMRSTIVGSLTFFMLNNGLSLWGMDPNYIGIIKAGVLLGCVYMSYDRQSGALPV